MKVYKFRIFDENKPWNETAVVLKLMLIGDEAAENAAKDLSAIRNGEEIVWSELEDLVGHFVSSKKMHHE